MGSRLDADLLDLCRNQSRGLVTLDLDFSNPIRFVPSRTAGIAVLRLPPRPGRSELSDAARRLASGLAERSLEGKRWVVQRGRLREYQEENQEDTWPTTMTATPRAQVVYKWRRLPGLALRPSW